MGALATPAVVLRRRLYGDADLMVTLLSRDQGKVGAIAKAAKKSMRRFAGTLEPFAIIEAVLTPGRGMPVLQEAALIQPFAGLRTDIAKTAYAGCWAEILDAWMEEGVADLALYVLLCHALARLDGGEQCPEAVNIFFQMKFLAAAGITPRLSHCSGCGRPLDGLADHRLVFDSTSGRLLCRSCAPVQDRPLVLSKGTIKQLQWMTNADLRCCSRMRFTRQGLEEGGRFLECFVPVQLGRKPRSLDVLRQLQGER